MDLKQFLDEKSSFYNNRSFIKSDPISVPHCFDKKEDIEISGLLTAIISWGRRDLIIKSASRLMDLMNNAPYDFLLDDSKYKYEVLKDFKYRTLNLDDLVFILEGLRRIYLEEGGLESVAVKGFNRAGSIKGSILEIRNEILKTHHLIRSEKHLANPVKGSAAKRINMFMRWMIRKDERGVDFGLWDAITPGELMCPLDLHSGRIARELGLLERKQNDWKAVEELTGRLRGFDRDDPVKYDFALFGVGVFEGDPF